MCNGCRRGTVLFEPGDRRVDFFLVLDGFIEAYASRGTAQQVVHVYGEQQFTGELNLFNDRAILVGGRMGGDGRVARLNCSQFRRLLAAEPDIANVVIRAIILRRERMFLHGQTGVTIIAPRRSAQSLQLQLFLTRNRHPYRLADPEADSGAAAQLSELGFAVDDAPVVVCGDDRVLVCPTPRELGDHIGIAEPLDPQHVADVVVVGAGPAGLAAAVYSASEGLDTVVLEADAPGGQASTSSRIENYLGFPIGISGRELAQRAQVQAQKFGARIIVPRTVVRLVTDSPPYILELDDGTQVRAHTVILATGARYRSLPLANIDRFEGCGVHYAATAVESDAVPRRRRGRRRRGQLRRAGRGLPVTYRQPCAHPGARRRIGVQHVRLPHPSHRGGARTHHRASAHRDHRAEWRAAPGHRYLARPGYRAVPDPPCSECVSHARGRAEHRVAQPRRRLGRQGICANGYIGRLRRPRVLPRVVAAAGHQLCRHFRRR